MFKFASILLIYNIIIKKNVELVIFTMIVLSKTLKAVNESKIKLNCQQTFHRYWREA